VPKTGSALKADLYHGFPLLVDELAEDAVQTQLRPGTYLYQTEGSLNGVTGRYEWIVENGVMTHRMFVANGTMNGVPIKK
jgi:filamentous hemagglutinin